MKDETTAFYAEPGRRRRESDDEPVGLCADATRQDPSPAVDAAFKKRLVEDATAAIAIAIAEMKLPAGMAGAEGEHIKVAENTAAVHNVIICTLCSCYPWPTLGLPP